MFYIKLTIVLIATALFAIACGQAATTPNTASNNANKSAATPAAVTPAPAATIDEATTGRDLYAKNCAECHKDSGKGGKVTIDGKTLDPDDISTAKMAAKPDEKLTEYITNGFPDDGMPAFKDKLKADEMKMIIRHVRTLQKQ